MGPRAVGVATTAPVDIVHATALKVEAYEPFQGSDVRAVDHTLSLIENTTAHQRAELSAIMAFSDGSSVDVSRHSLTSVSAVKAGVIEMIDGVVSAKTAGSTDLIVTVAGLMERIAIAVDDAPIQITALTAKPTFGTTLSAIQGDAADEIAVVATFADGTRDLVTGAFDLGTVKDQIADPTQTDPQRLQRSGLVGRLAHGVGDVRQFRPEVAGPGDAKRGA